MTASAMRLTVPRTVGRPSPLTSWSHEEAPRRTRTAVHLALQPGVAGYPGHRDLDLPAVPPGRRLSRLARRHVAVLRVHRSRRDLRRGRWHAGRLRWGREWGVRAAGPSTPPVRGSAPAAARLSLTLPCRQRNAAASPVAR